MERLCRLDPLSAEQLAQLRLPLREGGFGLRAMWFLIFSSKAKRCAQGAFFFTSSSASSDSLEIVHATSRFKQMSR